MGLSVERFQQPEGRFEGEIVADEEAESTKFRNNDGSAQRQYHLAVQPINPEREIQKGWYKIPVDPKTGQPRMSGQLAEVFQGLASVFAGQMTAIGEGQLIGKRAVFEYQPSFYTMNGREQQRTRDSLVAVAPLDAPAAKKGK